MIYPSLELFKEWSANSKVVPVSYEMNADMETPISLFKKFATEHYCYLYESVEGGERWARYSFMGRKPLMTLKTVNSITTVQTNQDRKQYKGNPIHVLDEILKEFKSETFSHLPRFYGGMVGYFGYDLVRYYEKIEEKNPDEIGVPECELFVPEEIIVYDHLKQKIFIIINTLSCKTDQCYEQAVKKIEDILDEIKSKNNYSLDMVPSEDHQISEFTASVSKEEFCSNVVKAKEYIRNGDIFQVVLSQRLKASYVGDPFNVYRSLRTFNPSPYMYYLKYEDYCIAGASPEMLVRLENGVVETCPIAGTRKRGKNAGEDEALALDLQADEKEVAEHTMLVDLGRNDVGKVSQFGTVKTMNLMHIEKYSHVMHMVTNVVGKKREDKTPIDVLTGVLPAGTVSGAPKVRAMEIIEEIENLKRGVYAGAIGYIGFDGNLDTCIAIRTAVFKDNKVYIQAGAGIVADSVPEKEYEETLNKAQAMVSAVQKAGEMK